MGITKLDERDFLTEEICKLINKSIAQMGAKTFRRFVYRKRYMVKPKDNHTNLMIITVYDSKYQRIFATMNECQDIISKHPQLRDKDVKYVHIPEYHGTGYGVVITADISE